MKEIERTRVSVGDTRSRLFVSSLLVSSSLGNVAVCRSGNLKVRFLLTHHVHYFGCANSGWPGFRLNMSALAGAGVGSWLREVKTHRA